MPAPEGTNNRKRRRARKEGTLPHPGGLGQAFFPENQPPTHCLPCFREGQGGQWEGEARSHKQRLRKQVQDNARRQAADVGSPRGPLGEGVVPALTSAAPWKTMRSSLALLTTGGGRGRAARGPSAPHPMCPSNQLGWKHEPRQHFLESCDSLGQSAPELII